jgi:RNA polymerase sigma factor (TIGR02999 family)
VLSEEKSEGKAPEITQLLVRWSNGDNAARDELIPLVYDELSRLAGRYLRHEPRECTLQPATLVRDVYLRLIKLDKVSFENRAQFYGLCATIMRNLLVDRARARKNKKRSGRWIRISINKADRINSKPDLDLMAVDEALSKLVKIRPRAAQVVELRFFGGLTVEETAESLGISRATVEREWDFAKAWLKRELREASGASIRRDAAVGEKAKSKGSRAV